MRLSTLGARSRPTGPELFGARLIWEVQWTFAVECIVAPLRKRDVAIDLVVCHELGVAETHVPHAHRLRWIFEHAILDVRDIHSLGLANPLPEAHFVGVDVDARPGEYGHSRQDAWIHAVLSAPS